MMISSGRMIIKYHLILRIMIRLSWPGIAIAAKSVNPRVRVYAVEPKGKRCASKVNNNLHYNLHYCLPEGQAVRFICDAVRD